MPLRQGLTWIATIAFLAACTPVNGSADVQVTLEATPVIIEPTITEDATAVIQAPTSTVVPGQAISTDPTPTAEDSFEICSPLGMHPLEELPQIISDPYKPPPPNKPEERHHGVDFGYWHYGERDTMLGEPVQAILGGVVASVLNDKYPYGNMILIETSRSELPYAIVRLLDIPPGDSLFHLYAHLDQPPDYALGDIVQACQPIGEVGESGNTDIPHLHLETRLGPAGKQFESMFFYNTRATIEEMENYVLWRTSGVFRHFDPMALLTYPTITQPD